MESTDERTRVRYEATRVKAATIFWADRPEAWRTASFLLWLRWLERQGNENLEGQERVTPAKESPWSWLQAG